MKPAPFVHHLPESVEDAVALLAEHAAEDGRILAGGQSLVPAMAFRVARPGHLIDINRIAALRRLETDGDALVIGAGVRHAAFHRPVAPGPLGPLMAKVVRSIAHYPIRTRGTFCGSLANADPSSEWCLLAATLGATIHARSAAGAREIAIDAFFEGIMTTTLAEDELLEAVRVPLLPDDTRWGFYEFSRRAGDYAMAAALATFRLVDGAIADARVGLGGAEAHPRRIPEAEAILGGRAPEPALFRQAAAAAADAIDPLEDHQTDAAYRRDLVRAVTFRALERAPA